MKLFTSFLSPVTANTRLRTFRYRIPFCNCANLTHLPKTHPGKLDLLELKPTYARLPFSNLAVKASRCPEVAKGLATGYYLINIPGA